MRTEFANYLVPLLEGGSALDELFIEYRGELERALQGLLNVDLESVEGATKAKKLQSEIRGGFRALERLEEIIRDATNKSNPDAEA